MIAQWQEATFTDATSNANKPVSAPTSVRSRDQALGTCVVSWTGCREAELREAFPDAVEIAGLQVSDAHRGRGVGTALIQTGEHLAEEAGRSLLVIGVAEDNPRAAQLYRPLGYTDTGVRAVVRYEMHDAAGHRVQVTEHSRVLTKRLPATGRP